MEDQALRRKRLREWIRDNFDGVTLRFASKIRKPQPQIQDMLDERKSFGSKVARDIEERAGMPRGYLDDMAAAAPAVSGVREPKQSYHGVMLTRAGALFAAEWEKLDVADRAETQADVEDRVAKAVRARRKRGAGKPKSDKPRPNQER